MLVSIAQFNVVHIVSSYRKRKLYLQVGLRQIVIFVFEYSVFFVCIRRNNEILKQIFKYLIKLYLNIPEYEYLLNSQIFICMQAT